MNQLMRVIQFFLDLNTLIREKASVKSCLVVGLRNAPLASIHPYEGVWRISSIKAIKKERLMNNWVFHGLLKHQTGNNVREITGYSFYNDEINLLILLYALP
jgi:hypothetical protein